MNKIAIIGMSGLFPGSSDNEGFWKNLMDRKDLTGLATSEDFGVDPSVFYEKGKGITDKCYSLRGGYIRDFNFDPNGFELGADFLAKQDKLFQWSLFVAKEALKDSGYYNKKEILNRCGLVLGNLSFPTGSSHKKLAKVYTKTMERALRHVLNDPSFSVDSTKYTVPENEVLSHTPSQMVSKALGLHTTHYELDAACATSLYAIKLACDELILGKSDLMLAGAVCGSDQLFIHMGFSIFHAYAAADKKFVPLDKDSAGLVSSEGAGMVVLKRLEDAERDGDQILGVIAGVGLSNDGRGKFLLSPNPKGQQLAFKRAYTEADVLPEKTSFIECHATGTPLGDVTEMNSIADFFQEYNKKPLLGSVKSNMGHLLTAAGMPGLLKVLLSIKNKIIPSNINLEEGLETNSAWLGQEQMILEPTPWNSDFKQAGINSFGFGGTNAHMVIQNHQKNLPAVAKKDDFSIAEVAIVGMDAHFGDCENLDEFYYSIFNNRQHFKDLPKSRWKGFEANSDLLNDFGLKTIPKGAYVADFEIDLLRFKIQPNEAKTLEPQQALILKVADNAIKDADLSESANVAVLIAMQSELAIHHYLARWDVSWQLQEALKKQGIELSEEEYQELENLCKNGMYFREGSQSPSQHTSFVGNIMASRIAALWDFTGPAFTISCDKNPGFRALEVAQNMLSLGEVDAVVVGAVDFSGGLEHVLLKHQQNPLSDNQNPTLSFDTLENGFQIGEGAGVVVLKRNKDVNDEKVYAVIDEIGQNKNTVEVDYLELNASGFQKEDQLELDYLSQASAKNKIALGGVKANIGHCFAAADIASVIKTSLCLYHRFIPGIPNWKTPKQIDILKNSPFYFPTKAQPWIKNETRGNRQAAINGSGQEQVLLSESIHRKVNDMPFSNAHSSKLFALKGDSAKALNLQLTALEIAIETKTPLSTIAGQFYETFKTKTGEYTVGLIARTKKKLQSEINFFKNNIEKAIEAHADLKTPSGSYFSGAPLGKEAKIAFVYPGSATAYEGLGQDVFQRFPDLMDHFENQVDSLEPFVYSNYLNPKRLSANEVQPNFYSNAIAMMSCGVFFSAVYTRLLRHYFKLEPEMAFGYSMGECSSMWYSLGLWDPKNAVEFQNSPIFKKRFSGDLELLAEHWNISTTEAKERWLSLIVLASKDQIEPLVNKKEKVYLTFINTENEVIISGDRKQCLEIVEELKCKSVEVPFQNVIHHDFCRKEKDGMIKMHNFPLLEKPAIDFYSSLTQQKINFNSTEIAHNSTEVCSQQVNFPAIVEQIYKEGARIFIETGAGATCSNWVKSILKNQAHLALAIDQKGKSAEQSLLELLAALISHGLDIDLSHLFQVNEKETKTGGYMAAIVPGGHRVFDEFYTPAIKEKFKQKKKIYAQANQQPILQTTQTALPNQNIISDNYRNQNTTTIMEIPTKPISPKTNNSKKIAENGLSVYDFKSDEHLKDKNIIFTQQDLEEFATGKIANVFGQDYAIIDNYRRRVMLPMYPYLLVSRVTGLKGTKGEYKPSTMQTEYDIPHNAWFTTDGQIPWAVSVESGQCDLLLISYLGIDFENKGNLIYRLLDCTLTFVDDLPFEGQTLRYDISINSFIRNGENLLFFFSYRCYVEDRLVLKMDGGCAGFFTDEQLEEGNGVVYTDKEKEVRANAVKRRFTPLLQTKKTTFSKEDLRHLINGEAEKCFDDNSYFANGRNPSLCLPPEKILMLDRITSVDIHGGAYGLGLIVAEKDLNPNDWYFPCHFRDDEVLAGSLQAEGGGNLLRFFMLMLGLQRLTKDARYQPVFDLPQKVRCRKQVTPKDTKLVYRLEIKEIGLVPNPYVIGDLEIISDGVVTVHFENLGLQLREKDNPKYLEETAGVKISPRSEGALLNEETITTFALDDLSKCFGPDFAVYDGRTVSRQPNTDLQLISRVLKVDGVRGDFSKPSTIYAEYDVPVDAWYYQQNSSNTMPYSILMEIALQPCGLLGAYLGSTLQFADKNLYFRNLDGDGEMFDLPNGTDFRGKTITNKAVLLSSIALGGVIIQKYTFECAIDGHVFYKGKSAFGFFPGESLAAQVGLDNGAEITSWHEQQGLTPSNYMQVKLDSLYGKMKLFKAPADKPHYKIAGDQLNLLDQLKIVKDGGEHGKGYVHASKAVQTYDWFFTCHFYQDPVMPGSLGVEAILQAIQVYALQQDLGKDFKNPRFVQLDNQKTVWKYRGQILLDAKEMHLEAHIKSIEMVNGQLRINTDAYLWNEGTRIYQLTDLGIGIEET